MCRPAGNTGQDFPTRIRDPDEERAERRIGRQLKAARHADLRRGDKRYGCQILVVRHFAICQGRQRRMQQGRRKPCPTLARARSQAPMRLPTWRRKCQSTGRHRPPASTPRRHCRTTSPTPERSGDARQAWLPDPACPSRMSSQLVPSLPPFCHKERGKKLKRTMSDSCRTAPQARAGMG